MAEISLEDLTKAVKAGMDESLGFTGGMTASERRAALGASSPSQSSSDVTTSQSTTTTTKPGAGKFDSSEYMKRLAKQLGPAGEAIPSALVGAIDFIGKAIQGQNDMVKQIVADDLDYIMSAREIFGNISMDMATGHLKIAGDAKQYVENFESILVDATNTMQESSELSFKEGYGSNLDPMYNFFVSATAAAEKFGKIMEAVGSDTPKIIQEINDIEAKKITFFAQTLGIVERDVSTLLERQYAFTGEASDKILGDIGTTAKALSDTTGIAAKQLKTGIVDIMRDVDKFGDIGVDSAGRISAALLQLGVDFNSFQRMTDQFMNFDSAAGKMGELSTLFGIQLDAMEMTYLANEDQEEFLFRMREEILDAGIDVENMSKTRARALTSQLGLKSVTEMKTFLREGELSFDQETLEGSTAMAEGMDALTVAGRDFGNEFARSAQTAAEAMDEKFIPGIVSSRDEMFKLGSQANQTYAAIQQFKLPEGFDKFRNEVTDIRIGVEQTKTVFADNLTDGVNLLGESAADFLFDTYEDNLKDFKDKMLKEVEDFYNKYKPENIDTIKQEMQVEIAAIDTNSIQEVVDQQAIVNLKTQEQVATLLDVLVTSKQQHETLMTKLNNEEPIIFRVDLDGDTIADTTYKVLLKNGQIITADTRS
tara:strand:+ start:645 stop:2600 length:1956 start_codon:yes stop_codon:yes gene_type:complete